MSESSPPRKRNRRRVGASTLNRAQVLEDEAREDCISDLQRMVNQDDYGDVIFICKDGERVRAIRSLIMGRCDVLKRMLANGMKETSLSEMPLPDVSSQALVCVFEFLYTGAIVHSQSMSWRLLFDVVGAAEFFLLPNLARIVIQLILGKIQEVEKDLTEVAVVLTTILEFSQSRQGKECDIIKRKLVDLLSSDWKHSLYVANLSEEALHYLLSHTNVEDNYQQVDDKSFGRQRKREPSLTEYYRFRQVILWWAHQNVPKWGTQVEENVKSAVPLLQDTSCLFSAVGIDDEHTINNSSLHLKSFLNTSRDAATRLLSCIDLQYMHPMLLEKVVRPLNCLSSSEMMRIFRHYTLDKIVRSVKFSNATCDWKHGASLRLGADRSSIKTSGRDTGSAIALMPMSSKAEICLWQFVIGEKDPDIQVGFYFADAEQVSGWGESHLSRRTLQYDSNARALSIYGDIGYPEFSEPQGERDGRVKYIYKKICKGSHVLFLLDFVERNCSLNVDGVDFGICWQNLPDRVCYPAVSLGPRSGLISIQTPRM